MKSNERRPEPRVALAYLRDNFSSDDRLAVLVVNRRLNAVTQRLASQEQIVASDFQSWLQSQNNDQGEIYVSMNTLRDGARGRTKSDIGAIRHVYLDFDENGTAALEALRKRSDMPPPNWVVGSSPGKWQVIWKVEGFEKSQAEALQKALARDTGADPAATDCTRVLRIPGFYNHKYAQPHLVSGERLTDALYRPEHFPTIAHAEREDHSTIGAAGAKARRMMPDRSLTQSERDWAYAKRALARGESPELVAAAIATFRRFDKPDPNYYARLTVTKAAASIQTQRSHTPDRTAER